MFQGERNSASRVSCLTDVYHHHNNHHNSNDNYHGNSHAVANNGQLHTPPPDDYPITHDDRFGSAGAGGASIAAWLEIWDYVGGLGFRGFLAEDEDGEKSAFVFFDAGVVGRDLKKALEAIIELADAPLGCSKIVVAVDRGIRDRDAKALMRGLQWVGFSLSTLDHWAGGRLDVVSPRWLFMAYEV